VLDFKAKQPNSKEEVLRAFEFALAHIGMDINANQIWADYINYVKSLKVIFQLTFFFFSFSFFVSF
jgi:hypothetical protein